MSYDYKLERPRIFSEEGVVQLQRVIASARKLIAESGCFMAGKVMDGDSWLTFACLDYLCEQGVLRLVEENPAPMGQHLIYKRGNGGVRGIAL